MLCAAPAQEHPRLLLPRSSTPQLFRSSSPRAMLLGRLSFGSIGASSSLGAHRLQRSTSIFFRNLYVSMLSYSPLGSMFTIW